MPATTCGSRPSDPHRVPMQANLLEPAATRNAPSTSPSPGLTGPQASPSTSQTQPSDQAGSPAPDLMQPGSLSASRKAPSSSTLRSLLQPKELKLQSGRSQLQPTSGPILQRSPRLSGLEAQEAADYEQRLRAGEARDRMMAAEKAQSSDDESSDGGGVDLSEVHAAAAERRAASRSRKSTSQRNQGLDGGSSSSGSGSESDGGGAM
ncbi:hypothetical protein QJQ45_009649 [Haematococcus lacustris]|nr:hypothetical protein QJQ45_009649 [Haematococcus lacustris]